MAAKKRRDKENLKNGSAEEKAYANKLKRQAKELTKVKEVNGSFENGHEASRIRSFRQIKKSKNEGLGYHNITCTVEWYP